MPRQQWRLLKSWFVSQRLTMRYVASCCRTSRNWNRAASTWIDSRSRSTCGAEVHRTRKRMWAACGTLFQRWPGWRRDAAAAQGLAYVYHSASAGQHSCGELAAMMRRRITHTAINSFNSRMTMVYAERHRAGVVLLCSGAASVCLLRGGFASVAKLVTFWLCFMHCQSIS